MRAVQQAGDAGAVAVKVGTTLGRPQDVVKEILLCRDTRIDDANRSVVAGPLFLRDQRGPVHGTHPPVDMIDAGEFQQLVVPVDQESATLGAAHGADGVVVAGLEAMLRVHRLCETRVERLAGLGSNLAAPGRGRKIIDLPELRIEQRHHRGIGFGAQPQVVRFAVERAQLLSEIADALQVGRIESVDVTPEGSDVAVEGADVPPESADVAVEGADVAVKRADIAVERADVAIEGADVSIKGADVAIAGFDRHRDDRAGRVRVGFGRRRGDGVAEIEGNGLYVLGACRAGSRQCETCCADCKDRLHTSTRFVAGPLCTGWNACLRVSGCSPVPGMG